MFLFSGSFKMLDPHRTTLWPYEDLTLWICQTILSLSLSLSLREREMKYLCYYSNKYYKVSCNTLHLAFSSALQKIYFYQTKCGMVFSNGNWDKLTHKYKKSKSQVFQCLYLLLYVLPHTEKSCSCWRPGFAQSQTHFSRFILI